MDGSAGPWGALLLGEENGAGGRAEASSAPVSPSPTLAAAAQPAAHTASGGALARRGQARAHVPRRAGRSTLAPASPQGRQSWGHMHTRGHSRPSRLCELQTPVPTLFSETQATRAPSTWHLASWEAIVCSSPNRGGMGRTGALGKLRKGSVLTSGWGRSRGGEGRNQAASAGGPAKAEIWSGVCREVWAGGIPPTVAPPAP